MQEKKKHAKTLLSILFSHRAIHKENERTLKMSRSLVFLIFYNSHLLVPPLFPVADHIRTGPTYSVSPSLTLQTERLLWHSSYRSYKLYLNSCVFQTLKQSKDEIKCVDLKGWL